MGPGVDDGRPDPAGAEAVNVAGAVGLASWLAERGTPVLFLSTNQVFDGSVPHRPADDALCPVSEYGRQKAAAEAGIRALPGAGVLRLTKVVHPGLPLFDGWAADLCAGRPISPFSDFPFAPVTVDLVAETIRRIVAPEDAQERSVAGVWQLSAPGDVTYADAARHVVHRLGCDPALVRPVAGVAHTLMGGDRPSRWTSLDTARVRAELGLVPPSAMEAVMACLDTGPDAICPDRDLTEGR
ncbi:sugar nucleotide-binding protein [Azospirillum sp. C340-1]|uniref:Sugar nucleotide-binding protein n=1 Tax=Azospirillum isscasi TaxID=3053926 RepID=A0ABU0WMK2_9PROT|nr:sugar nucleotide-binding protein [Azospirillum isscasi]